MKKILNILSMFVLMMSVGTNYVLAAEFRTPMDDGSVTVLEGEEVENLYTGGNLVSISADVEKGLYVGGNVVTVEGDVGGNLAVGGGTVVVGGDVGGTVHAGGGSIIIKGRIEDDLIIGGGNITIADTAYIGGDLIVGGGVVTINAPVDGDVIMGAGQATLNSKVGGEVKAEVESLQLGDKAEVMGGITYKSPQELMMADGALVAGEVEYSQISKVQNKANLPLETLEPRLIFKMASLGFLMKLAISIVTGLALVYMFSRWVGQATNESLTNFWSSLGLGFAALFLTPILAVILIMTLVGVKLTVLMMAAYCLMLMLALPLASIMLGSLLMKLFQKSSKYEADWKAVVLGALAMGLIALVPLVGWLTYFVFILASLGSLYQLLYKSMKRK